MTRQAPDVLYHYTCRDHGRPGIERTGRLRPRRHPWLPLAPMVWLTDLDRLDDDPLAGIGLGLTRRRRSLLVCDRTAMRYTVATAGLAHLSWWPEVRGYCDPMIVADLESDGWPSRWWVAFEPVPVLREVAEA